MKKILLSFFAVVMFWGIAARAGAVTIYTDIYNPEPNIFLDSAATNSHSWTFDITNDGFDPAVQDVVSAFVLMSFTDNDSDWFYNWEIADLLIGDNTFLLEVDTGGVQYTLTSFVTLSDTGTIDATLTADWGDFYFNDATLQATAVPEPGSILLFGSGLGLLLPMVRRKVRK